MNEQRLDYLLSIGKPVDPEEFSLFTREFMDQLISVSPVTKSVRHGHTNGAEVFSGLWWRMHRALLVLIFLVASICSFTGYAYATGNTPIGLLKRWLVGNEVHVEYQGKTFTYGKRRTYSDAAVTAMDELTTVQELFNNGTNGFIVPKNGVEYVLNPANTPYAYPWIGTVTQVTATTITATKQYVVGDKMTPDQVMSMQVTLPLSQTSYAVQGKTALASHASVGKLIEVRQASYLRHQIGSSSVPTAVTHYFAYQLNHDLKDIEAATKLGNLYQSANEPLQALSFSNDINLCLNNGANICEHNVSANDGSRSLFGESTDPSTGQEYGHYNNPSVIDFGQGSPSGPNPNYVMRSVEGEIVAINQDALAIKSSSGTVWTLGYSASDRAAFTTKYHNPKLAIGDDINASILSRTTDLDNRTIASQYVYQMVRYLK